MQASLHPHDFRPDRTARTGTVAGRRPGSSAPLRRRAASLASKLRRSPTGVERFRMYGSSFTFCNPLESLRLKVPHALAGRNAPGPPMLSENPLTGWSGCSSSSSPSLRTIATPVATGPHPARGGRAGCDGTACRVALHSSGRAGDRKAAGVGSMRRDRRSCNRGRPNHTD